MKKLLAMLLASLMITSLVACGTKDTTPTPAENTGDTAMFFSIGAHPAFNCKMGDFIKFDEYETLETYTFDTSSFRTGTKPFMERRKNIEITEHLFDDDALVFSGMKSRGLEIISRGGSRIVRVDYGN